VENIAGASGNIGPGQVAKAAPDGYTILFAFSSHVVNPTLFARVPYDLIKDFDPVTLAVASTTVLTVNPSVPAKTVKELVDLIKANPGKYSFGSAGAGTQAHLFERGIIFRHDVVSGAIEDTFQTLTSASRSQTGAPGKRRSPLVRSCVSLPRASAPSLVAGYAYRHRSRVSPR
jgi:Tripartite tricarboxylate transporter family receptor